MSDKKKKGGCLKIGLVVFVVFIVLGFILSFFEDKAWEKERVEIMAEITQAKNHGDLKTAYDLTEPYLDRVETDDEFASITEDVVAWKEQQELNQINDEFKKAESENNDTLILELAAKHKARLSKMPEASKIAKEADDRQKARKAKELAAKQKAEADALAARPLHQKIKDLLHLKVGSKTSLFGEERKWKALRNVDAIKGSEHASITFDNESSEMSVFNDISKVIESVFEFNEINTLNIQVFSEYMDTNGNTSSLLFLNVKLNREAAKKANWNNLRSYNKVRGFLEKNGQVIMRGKR